jgi:hypothetical protein
MKILRPRLLTASLALASTLGLQAADFEGTIDLSIKEGRQSHQLTYATKAGQLRITMDGGPMGQLNSIIDIAGGKILILMDAQSMYLEMPIAGQIETAINDRTADAAQMKRSDETMKILGYTCHKYTFDEDDGPVEIWATDQLGQFVAMPKGNPMQPTPTKKSWDQFIAGDFFPMRILALDKKGMERMRWDLTKVTPKTLPESLFSVPTHYRKLDMGAMMQGLGGLLGN